ncbi:STM4504/CBY_0614 family protein [Oecophyllibacter saccharovorans]|uniref:HEPN domain-containing protein n=1 Tax=Oecophyllibacter saccharovorans TaxID=2558360 RepID=A0A506UKW2_9PROT|nr:HEPN domain-containing protein [Oecophyllibacter saccharovorans]TPW33872.1 HEPN domain-containing protein [Oecophyllibacter saccharovorans]
MVLYNTYSRRLKQETIPEDDFYQYNDIPMFLRKQILHISEDILGRLKDSIGTKNNLLIWNCWYELYNSFRREIGLSSSTRFPPILLSEEIESLFLSPNVKCNSVLDFVDILMELSRNLSRSRNNFIDKPKIDLAIKELNARFLDAKVGYQYEENGEEKGIVRIDNKEAHKELVKPALKLLSNPLFSQANKDYRNAHEHYRSGNVKDCIAACNRAFEAMMKAICSHQGWEIKGDRASDLIKLLRNNGLFLEGQEKFFDTYIAMLKTGIPELRNENGGHGDEPETPERPLYLASYALHLTATNLLFLGDAWAAYSSRQAPS